MDDDMTSKLPDVLIQQIISFLSMKEAVRTSILSKRWEFLWTSSPNLVFDLCNEEAVKFVDRALFLRQSRVHKFSICFNDFKDIRDNAIHLRRWIMYVVSLNVEELNLELRPQDFGYFLEFPQCLLDCASLTSFSLHSWWHLRSSPSINLSNLKNLLLEYVYFDDAESVDSLFSGCPMLETTSLLQCTFMCDCRISAPKLYKLVVEEPLYTPAPVRNVMVFAPSLKSFHLRGLFTNFYYLNDQPSLDEAELSVQYQPGKRIWVYKLLKDLPLMKKLSLSYQALESLRYQGNLLGEAPIFKNLYVLSFVGYESIRLDLGDHYIGLMNILQNSPCLETLRFETGIVLYADREEYARTLDPVPPCLLSSLKTLEILFEKDDDCPELFMNAARMLLERASVLEKLILYPSKPLAVYPMDKEKLINDLNELPRASNICQFEFSDFKMKSI